MSEKSAIEWTDATWNPVLGCDKVSQGCRGCYAIPQSWMKQHNPNEKIRAAYEGLVVQIGPGSYNWTGRVNLLPDRLTLPLTWKQPRKIFVTSLSDLFHKEIPDDFIDQVFAVMALTPRHTYQILTKRPERMQRWVTEGDPLEDRAALVSREAAHIGGVVWDSRGSEEHLYSDVAGMPGKHGSKERTEHLAKRRVWPGWPLPNVWLGTSTEDQATADERIPHLLRTPAAVRFLSCEPLLGPMDVTCIGMAGEDEDCPHLIHRGPCTAPTDKLDWVIAGGESGPNFRPMDLDWARSLRDQCEAAGAAFNFKQVGGRTPKAGGRLLDGVEHSAFPTVATSAGAS